jgi:glycosyltransferase 2 family protein
MQPEENTSDSPTSHRPIYRRLKLILSYAIAGACLAWVLYNVHPKLLLQNIAHLKWHFALLAIAADNANYLSQGVRWKLLLQPVAAVRTLKAIQATYVAIFTNNVLPMRIGEIVRAYLISKRYGRPLSEIFPSMVLEHLLEGILLALGIGFATFLLPASKYLQRGAQVFGLGVILLAALFFYALIREEKALPVMHPPDVHVRIGARALRKLRIFIEHIAVGMRRIGLSTCFFMGFGMTLFSLFMQVVALMLVARACSLPIALWKAGVVLLIIRVGVVIPNAPANLGTYQFFAALGMELLGVDRYAANSFAVVLFFVLMTPTWLTGFFALSRSGSTLLRLQHEARDAAGTS